MLRYSLAALLIAVVAVSVGCAAITHATPLWSQIVFTATVLLFLAAAVVAIVARPRPFAAGFAVFGWGYLLLATGSWAPSVRPHLLTETVLAKLEPLLPDSNANATMPGGLGGGGYGGMPGGGWSGGSTLWVTGSNPFGNVITYNTYPYTLTGGDGNPWLRQIGHTLWAIMLAALGGALARLVAARSARFETSSSVRA